MKNAMTREYILDVFDKQFAYDEGSTDSGVNDPERVDEIMRYIHVNHDVRTCEEINSILTEFVRNYCTDPYTWEDAKRALMWLEEKGIE